MPPGIRPLRILQLLAYVGAWALLAAVGAALIFVESERTVEVASHDAVVSPNFSGHIVLRTGPIVPDVRADSGSVLGVRIELGKTDTTSMEELTERYAAIAAQPAGQIAVVSRAVRTMALAALVQGAALAAVPLVLWAAIGHNRRRELLHDLPTSKGAISAALAVVVLAGVVAPVWWGKSEPEPERWTDLQTFVGPLIDLPKEAQRVEVLAGGTTAQSRRLVGSAVSSYQQGQRFYAKAAEDAAELGLREPEEGETVAVLVSDRHLNIGMDLVTRAIGDRAGATAVLDAGDDTSVGERWEAFALDSLDEAFEGYEGRWAVAGNHDNGTFVRDYLSNLGWTYFDGEPVEGPGGSRLMGADDPRASGLGNWRDETGLSSEEVARRLTEAACEADADGKRVNTLLVHDADFGDGALAAGCVDLVIGGHVHVQDGPKSVVGANGRTGYTYTNGTTGGAAYAIAIGTKLRRPAGVTLITYRDGRPVGVQAVTLQTNGRYDVDPWKALTYGSTD